jgi:hypothetical protein
VTRRKRPQRRGASRVVEQRRSAWRVASVPPCSAVGVQCNATHSQRAHLPAAASRALNRVPALLCRCCRVPAGTSSDTCSGHFECSTLCWGLKWPRHCAGVIEHQVLSLKWVVCCAGVVERPLQPRVEHEWLEWQARQCRRPCGAPRPLSVALVRDDGVGCRTTRFVHVAPSALCKVLNQSTHSAPHVTPTGELAQVQCDLNSENPMRRRRGNLSARSSTPR